MTRLIAMRVRGSIHDQVNSNEGQRVDLSMIRLIVMRVRQLIYL